MWTPVANMNGRRLQFGVAVLDDKLYVVGGRDGLKTLNTVECYNPKTKTWSVMPPMSTHRHGLGEITADLFILSCIGLYGIFTFFTWQKISVAAAEPTAVIGILSCSLLSEKQKQRKQACICAASTSENMNI